MSHLPFTVEDQRVVQTWRGLDAYVIEELIELDQACVDRKSRDAEACVQRIALRRRCLELRAVHGLAPRDKLKASPPPQPGDKDVGTGEWV